MFTYKEEYSWLTNICLNITDNCNLRCKYCFIEEHPNYMSQDIAFKSIDFIMKNLEKKRKKYNSQERGTINFFGGEPTLLWNEIIVPVTNYIKENDLPIDIGMTTNGTLLNKERIDFLKNNNIQLLLSMDGDKETQDFNRPCANGESSFDKINKIIPDLLEAFPNITFRSTIYAPTVENTFKNYLFAVEKGFKNIFLMPDARHFWSEEEKEKLLQEIDKIFIYNEICFSKNILPINFSTINNMMKELILFFSDKKIELEISRNIYRCGLGTINGSIGFDGSIYGCQEQPSKKEKNIFYIGNLKEGINKEKHLFLLKEYNKKRKVVNENKNRCNDCCLRKICTGWLCPSSSWDLFKNFHVDSEIACLWREKIFSNSAIMYLKLKDNLFFQEYFKEVIK